MTTTDPVGEAREKCPRCGSTLVDSYSFHYKRGGCTTDDWPRDGGRARQPRAPER